MYTSPYATYLSPQSDTLPLSKLKMPSEGLEFKPNLPPPEPLPNLLSGDLDYKLKHMLTKPLKIGL